LALKLRTRQHTEQRATARAATAEPSLPRVATARTKSTSRRGPSVRGESGTSWLIKISFTLSGEILSRCGTPRVGTVRAIWPCERATRGRAPSDPFSDTATRHAHRLPQGGSQPSKKPTLTTSSERIGNRENVVVLGLTCAGGGGRPARETHLARGRRTSLLDLRAASAQARAAPGPLKRPCSWRRGRSSLKTRLDSWRRGRSRLKT